MTANATTLGRARAMLSERRRMERLFNPDLFADPARDILLSLFVAAEERRKVSVSKCCLVSHVPYATALRWIAALEREELIERHPDPQDARIVYLGLTQRAQTLMTEYLSA